MRDTHTLNTHNLIFLMTANVPLGFPEAIFDSQAISDAFVRKAITPAMVRDDAII